MLVVDGILEYVGIRRIFEYSSGRVVICLISSEMGLLCLFWQAMSMIRHGEVQLEP